MSTYKKEACLKVENMPCSGKWRLFAEVDLEVWRRRKTKSKTRRSGAELKTEGLWGYTRVDADIYETC